MFTGKYALLAGVQPGEVDRWYLGVYVDAVEWVEMTNTRGMSQFADGGLIATKPYVSSANYIGRMSDYCSSCPYESGRRHGDDACPFNCLYWAFYERHRGKLSGNPRVGMMYRVWDGMERSEREATLALARRYLRNIDKL